MSDWQTLGYLRDLKDAQQATVEELRKSRAVNERIAEQQEKLLTAFNKVAFLLEEVLGPKNLDKEPLTGSPAQKTL